jgi:hypothetical protein
MANLRTIRRADRFIGFAMVPFAIALAVNVKAAAKHGPPEVVTGNVTRLKGTFMAKGEPVTIALPSGGTIRFYANTEATFLTDPQALMLLPGKKTATYSVILRKGQVDVELPEEGTPRSAVAVGTSSDTRVVTLSGKVCMRAEGANITTLSYGGLTTVTQGTKLTRLPNQIKRTYLGKAGTTDLGLLGSTSWVGGKRVWLAIRSTVKVSGYTWSPVAGAIGYEIALVDKATGQALHQQRTLDTRLEGDGFDLKPGQYELRITAIDRDGFISPQSQTFDIRVVGVVLPPGAEILKNNTISIGFEQKLSLEHAEGLTLTTADHRGNVPATSAFGLANQDRASILIHPQAGGDVTTLTLVRRENLVQAWVGPKHVTWPLDPVELRIELKDARGQKLDPRVEPTAKVTIGVTPVTVDWIRDENFWHAQLPAQTGRGPWVVRLEVLDQYGVLIGRDFVEVALTQAPRKKDANATNPDPLVDPLEF